MNVNKCILYLNKNIFKKFNDFNKSQDKETLHKLFCDIARENIVSLVF